MKIIKICFKTKCHVWQKVIVIRYTVEHVNNVSEFFVF